MTSCCLCSAGSRSANGPILAFCRSLWCLDLRIARGRGLTKSLNVCSGERYRLSSFGSVGLHSALSATSLGPDCEEQALHMSLASVIAQTFIVFQSIIRDLAGRPTFSRLAWLVWRTLRCCETRYGSQYDKLPLELPQPAPNFAHS